MYVLCILSPLTHVGADRLRDGFLIPRDLTFESTLVNVRGEEKRGLIKFIKRMLTWRPEDRSTAKELAKDPWLYEDLPSD